MKLELTQVVDSLHQEFQKSQCALDKYTAHVYVQRLIFSSRNQRLSFFSLKNMILFHHYKISLRVSFQVYSPKKHPELIQLRKPCVIMRLFRTWEKKSVTINIFNTGTPSRNECILFVNDKPVGNYCIDDNFR